MCGMRTPGAAALLWLCGLLVMLGAIPLVAFDKPSHKQLPEQDRRVHVRQAGPRENQAAALRRLEKINARIDFHDVHGSPQWIRAAGGFLTGAEPQPGDAARNGVRALPPDAAGPIKRFVDDNSD